MDSKKTSIQWEKFKIIFDEELDYIRKRRDNISEESIPEDKVSEIKDGLFGIALSGGGIRSATLNLGILNCLNEKKILKLADYISSVSGGGFINSYIQSKLKAANSFDKLFNEDKNVPISGDNKSIRSNCDYLIPDHNLFSKLASYIRTYGAIVSSFIMNLLWLFFFLLLSAMILQSLIEIAFSLININAVSNYLAVIFVLVILYHYFFFALRNKKLWSSNLLNYFEGLLFVLIVVVWGFKLVNRIPSDDILNYLFNFKFLNLDLTLFNEDCVLINLFTVLLLFLIFSLFANPNILSLHRYYRDRIAEAFIKPFIPQNPKLMLYDIINDKSVNPYPLINTCLNLTDKRDKNMIGNESSDYFLLSPKFCGSSFTDYLSTKAEYNSLTLSTAAAISGSAVSTLMGNRTNRFISVVLYLSNAVLGYWIKNPNWRQIKPFKNLKNDFLIKYFTFWPFYLWNSMLGKANQTRGRVNISDGGHIENLAIFELLRRRCKLIIAVDASADPKYGFGDLENLIRRVREKLGLIIKFEEPPENIIRPVPSFGYSLQHYSKAKITCLPNTPDCDETYEGILIYIKSSLKAPQHWDINGGTKDKDEASAFNYKINHPAFPHESTIDQFFDPDQWDAYYFLGRFIASDIFNFVPSNLEDLIHHCSTLKLPD